jgi:hypothetical protein
MSSSIAAAPTLETKPSPAAATTTLQPDARYSFHTEKLAELRNQAPWTNDAKYFESVALSPSAIIKIVRF